MVWGPEQDQQTTRPRWIWADSTDSYQDGKGKAQAEAKDKRISKVEGKPSSELLISTCSTPGQVRKMIPTIR